MPDKISIYDAGEHYEPSESEGEYDEREKKLLKNIRDRHQTKRHDDPEEVLGFDEEDEDYEEDSDEEIRKFEHDSDIEDQVSEDDLPSRKAWGSKARSFYGTDYVDQDYDSITAQEEERAELEEIEAKEIQQRLAKELNEADFSLDIFTAGQESTGDGKKKSKKKKDKTDIKLQTDLSDLSERQRKDLFRKEAPEFDGLVEDFEKHLSECHEVLEPVLKYLQEKGITDHPFSKFLQTKYDYSITYCTNISFYLLLKTKRMNVKNHPVVKRMVQLKQILLELDQKFEVSIKDQVQTVLEHIASGTDLDLDDESEQPKTAQKKLAMLENLENGDISDGGDEESTPSDESEKEEPVPKKVRLSSESEDDEQLEPEGDGEDLDDSESKRKITYQMAKNRGLTPHKKKHQRNIRVKNRRKFEKAVVRRKGAIQAVKKETTRYSGEATGIKAYVKRSIKIK